MPVPIQLNRPVRRPPGQMVTSAQWVGPDDDLQLEVSYLDALGMPDVITFTTANTNEGRKGEICMASSAEAPDIPRDTVVSHIRMGGFCASALIGTFEWDNLWIEQEGSKDLQLACGTCSITARRIVSDTCVEVDVRIKGGNHPTGTFLIGVDELTNYEFTPSTQLKTIAGSVKKQFPTFEHEYPGTILSANDRQSVVDYVEALEIWV